VSGAFAQPAAPPARIAVDYPLERTVFPPDLAPPTFVWRDPVGANTSWRIDVKFADGSPALQVAAPGEPMKIGEIDERCVGPTNELPKLTPEQAASRTWKPDPATWESITKGSVRKPAAITITGLQNGRATSRGTVNISTSKDPVGAPIFFRDVPLMPAEVEKGVIKPLPKPALPLVAWRLRYVNEPKSRLMIDNLPTCMNCHSFSSDGKTLGLDLDGPQNDKGLYALVPIQKEVSIRKENVVSWSSFRGKLGSKIRVGFMSRVSPDGNYVVTMVNGGDVIPDASEDSRRLPKDVGGNFYVSNFKDYRFLQVFYPTRGILAWYSRETGKLQPLPGADDPRYVHTNAVWSPDGKYLVFARAAARDPYPAGSKLATVSNDPNETPIQYDLYRIPFNGGKGGTPEPIAGASANGMSNSFPKISPDGRWIAFVQARNGLLMRPDGKLYIVPATGGKPRLMNCNTPLMNSWHSFSPNGRWMVFSSKSRSPYTQMYLTHIDEQGNDTPAVLIENATAANRAVNIPEFVNIPLDAWLKMDAPATDFYRMTDAALDLFQSGRHRDAISEFRKLVEMDPEDATARNNLGAALSESGDFAGAAEQFTKVLSMDPENYKAYSNLGVALGRVGKFPEAEAQFQKALSINPDDPRTHGAFGAVLFNSGNLDQARVHLEKAIDINPGDADARNNLGGILARGGNFGEAIPHFEKALEYEPRSFVLHYNLGRALAANGRLEEGIRHVEQAAELSGGTEVVILERLSSLYVDARRTADALATARRALDLATRQGNAEAAGRLRAQIAALEQQ
jgi:Flp pilus assembly protein TadD